MRSTQPLPQLERPASCRRRSTSWKTGACHASVSRRAIVLRSLESFSTSTSPHGRCSRAAAGRRAAARSTSSATIRPSGPVPRERRELDAALARDPARQRRRLDALTVRLGGTGRPFVRADRDVARSRSPRARRASRAGGVSRSVLRIGDLLALLRRSPRPSCRPRPRPRRRRSSAARRAASASTSWVTLSVSSS